MEHKSKLIFLVISFLLLIPFRLPIAVLFINLITWIAELAAELNDSILVANIIVTKLIYDLAIASLSIYNVEGLIRGIRGRPSENIDYRGNVEIQMFYWQSIAVIISLICYIIFDCVTTYELFFELIK